MPSHPFLSQEPSYQQSLNGNKNQEWVTETIQTSSGDTAADATTGTNTVPGGWRIPDCSKVGGTGSCAATARSLVSKFCRWPAPQRAGRTTVHHQLAARVVGWPGMPGCRLVAVPMQVHLFDCTNYQQTDSPCPQLAAGNPFHLLQGSHYGIYGRKLLQ